MMIYYLKLYLITFSAFIVIDMVWLGLVASTFYQKHLGFIMAPSPNWIAAIIFYLLFIAGILFFVVLGMGVTRIFFLVQFNRELKGISKENMPIMEMPTKITIHKLEQTHWSERA